MVARAVRVLVVEDDPLFVRTLQLKLGGAGGPFALSFCGHTELALQWLAKASFDLLLLDLHLGKHEHGLLALPKLRAAAPGLPIVVHSVASDHASIVEAMRCGAFDYLPKHVGLATLAEQLQLLVARARAQAAAPAAAAAAAAPAASPRPVRCAHRAGKIRDAEGGGGPAVAAQAGVAMVGSSAALQALHKDLAVARRSNGNVLILGESGVGKELAAKALQRAGAPFVAVDAGTIDGSLASSILFGHERGAFTGAQSANAGLFERAHGGVLYLDEVANLSLEVQAKLLRVLQEREIWRLGGQVPRALQFRLICATNACLTSLSRQGRFRHDLLTRMQVFVLQVPALRERRDDIPALFAHFLRQYGAPDSIRWTPALQRTLLNYAFPGNVRELAQVAEVALAQREGSEALDVGHLPSALRAEGGPTGWLGHPGDRAPAPWGPPPPGAAASEALGEVPAPEPLALPPMPGVAGDFYAQVRAFERRTLIRAFAAHHGNISAMARTLGMDRSSLYAKLRLYAIHLPRPR